MSALASIDLRKGLNADELARLKADAKKAGKSVREHVKTLLKGGSR